MNWDDLRYFAEIARTGTLTAAARRLRVDQTTVARRLRVLEKRLGAALFEHGDGRWSLTELGARILERSAEIEDGIAGIERIAQSGSAVVVGTVRITTITSIAIEYLAPRLAQLYARHPLLAIELIESNDNLSIARREADIAIRLARPESGDFLIRKLADCGLAVYISTRRREAASAQNYWVAYQHDLARTPEMRWLAQQPDGTAIRLRSNNPHGLAQAIAGGVGRGVLPCFLADPLRSLARVSGAEPILRRPLWMLRHRDSRQQANVSAVAQWLIECFDTDAAMFRGARSPAAPRRQSRAASNRMRR